MTFTRPLARTSGAIAVAAALGLAGLAHAEVDMSAVPSGTYNSDPTHSYITFSYSHLGLSDPMLAFDDFEIEMNLDSEEPTRSMINVTIDPSSIVAGSEIWNDHLTGEDYFDVANHPDITFQSSDISEGGDGAYKVDGDLTIKGVSKPVSLSVTVNAAMDHPMSGDPVVGITGSGELLRSEFGMGTFAPNVSDEVTLQFTAEMVKAK